MRHRVFDYSSKNVGVASFLAASSRGAIAERLRSAIVDNRLEGSRLFTFLYLSSSGAIYTLLVFYFRTKM